MAEPGAEAGADAGGEGVGEAVGDADGGPADAQPAASSPAAAAAASRIMSFIFSPREGVAARCAASPSVGRPARAVNGQDTAPSAARVTAWGAPRWGPAAAGALDTAPGRA